MADGLAPEWYLLGERWSALLAAEERPLTPLLVSGFVVSCGDAFARFHIDFRGERVYVLADGHTSAFLLRCLGAGLHCWVTGCLVSRGPLSFMSCERAAVWLCGRREQLLRTPLDVLAQLCDCERERAYAHFLRGDEPQGRPLALHAVHPLAYESTMAYMERAGISLVGSACAALLSLKHTEALARGGASIFCPALAVRVGASPLFVEGGRPVLEPTASPRAEALHAALVVCDLGEEALWLLRHFVAMRDWGQALVLATREALPGALQAVGEAHLALTRRDLPAAMERSSGAGSLLLCLAGIDDACEHIGARAWRLVVLVGWPAARLPAALPCDFAVAIGLAAEAAAETSELGVDCVPPLASLFRVAPQRLREPGAMRALMEGRAFRQRTDRPPVGLRKFRYRRVRLDGAAVAGVGARRRQRAALFGDLAPDAPDFPEAADALAHLSAGAQVGPFAAGSLAGPPQGCCPVCLDDEVAPRTATRCGHWFCRSCLLSSLSLRGSCPVCKLPLDRAADVVSLPGGRRTDSCREVLDRLAEAAAEQRVVLLSSYGEVHERLLAPLRARGCAAQAWRGNAGQLMRAEAAFRGSPRGVLLVDVTSLPVRWLRPPPVGLLVVLQPLYQLKQECCCQLREALECFEPAALEVLGSEAEPKEMPLCGSSPPCGSARCPTLLLV